MDKEKRRPGNPNMVKGAPSLNPRGRAIHKAAATSPIYSSFAATTNVPPGKPAGADGVYAPGGFLFNGEKRRELQEGRKWVTFDNIVANFAIVAAALRAWTDLGGSSKWTAKPNPRGGKDAEKCAEIIQSGTIDATLSKPWRNVIKRQLMKKFRGFALHEVLVRRRADGVVVLADLQHRPQWTVWRWDKPSAQLPWQGIEQRDRAGVSYIVPRDRLFYSVEDTFTDAPDGVGLLRHIVETADALQRYQDLEGIGFDTDLRGMPLGRAPLGKLAQQAKDAGATTPDEIKAYVLAQVTPIANLLDGHVKTTNQSLLLDSAVYTGLDAARAPSTIYEWSFDTIKGATTVMPEIGPAIHRLIEDIARVMSAEWLLVGGKGGSGSFAMHADKTQMFGLAVNASLADVGDDATRDIAARLTVLNGYDPETCTPTFVPEPVATQSVTEACAALAALAQAGAPIRPGWDGINVLLSRMDLPDQPADDLASLVIPKPKPKTPPPAPASAATTTADAIGDTTQPAAPKEAA